MNGSINIITTNHCQLRCKFCLNTKLNNNFPKEVHSYEGFVETIDKCIEYGFNRFDLTPNIGDIFLDPDIMKKIEYLENNKNVERYEFVTNFLAIKKEDIEKLFHTNKCECAISIYGPNKDAYKEITGIIAFNRFLKNFVLLRDMSKKFDNFDIFMFYMRYSKLEDFPESSIKECITDMLSKGAILENAETTNRNWGGMMLDNVGEKKGICSRLLSENGIYSNGDITACNCWDWNKELIIGNMNEQSLEEIYSMSSIYGNLLADQFKNIYAGPCITCDDFNGVRDYDLHHEWSKIYKLFYK